jgi:hypothetical protein
MQPLTLQDLKDNPAVNPEVALYLLSGARFVPVLLGITWTFDSTSGITEGKTTDASLGSPLGATTWINQTKYVLERKNADIGSTFKGQNDVFTGRDPYVDVNILVPYAPISYLITPEYIALGTLADTCINWTLRKNATVTGTARLSRDLQASENPYIIKLTLIGYQINPTLELENIIGKMDNGEMLRACGCGGVSEYLQQKQIAG